MHTFQPYVAFEASPIEGRAWLSEFGEDLPLVHDDARGCLFFPDVCAPRGRGRRPRCRGATTKDFPTRSAAATYDAALAVLGDDVVFLQPQSLDVIRAEKKAKLRKLFGEGSDG